LISKDNILKRRESNLVEFKEKFDWNNRKARSNYAKSLTAFSNNKGGAIFFGIKDRPREIVGIDNFDEIDEADISNYLNELFTPYIIFTKKTYEINNKTIGIIYAEKNKRTPIICLKDSEKTNSGDIYFRYGAKSDKIKPGDLNNLLSEIINNINKRWLDTLAKISNIGIENVGIFDPSVGTIFKENTKYILDEKLVEKLNYIDKYFVSEEGGRAIKIIGKVEEISKIISKPKLIFEEDILKEFLTNELNLNWQDVLNAISHFNTE